MSFLFQANVRFLILIAVARQGRTWLEQILGYLHDSTEDISHTEAEVLAEHDLRVHARGLHDGPQEALDVLVGALQDDTVPHHVLAHRLQVRRHLAVLVVQTDGVEEAVGLVVDLVARGVRGDVRDAAVGDRDADAVHAEPLRYPDLGQVAAADDVPAVAHQELPRRAGEVPQDGDVQRPPKVDAGEEARADRGQLADVPDGVHDGGPHGAGPLRPAAARQEQDVQGDGHDQQKRDDQVQLKTHASSLQCRTIFRGGRLRSLRLHLPCDAAPNFRYGEPVRV